MVYVQLRSYFYNGIRLKQGENVHRLVIHVFGWSSIFVVPEIFVYIVFFPFISHFLVTFVKKLKIN